MTPFSPFPDLKLTKLMKSINKKFELRPENLLLYFRALKMNKPADTKL